MTRVAINSADVVLSMASPKLYPQNEKLPQIYSHCSIRKVDFEGESGVEHPIGPHFKPCTAHGTGSSIFIH